MSHKQWSVYPVYHPSNFRHYFTLLSECFSTFARATCLLSVSLRYLVLEVNVLSLLHTSIPACATQWSCPMWSTPGATQSSCPEEQTTTRAGRKSTSWLWHQPNTESFIIRKQNNSTSSFYHTGRHTHNSVVNGFKRELMSVSFAITLDISFDFFSSA